MSPTLQNAEIPVTVARQGSALCVYFMDHEPTDWHDLASNHNFTADLPLRQELINRGIYVLPAANKQWSISAAHSEEDLGITIEAVRELLDRGALVNWELDAFPS